MFLFVKFEFSSYFVKLQTRKTGNCLNKTRVFYCYYLHFVSTLPRSRSCSARKKKIKDDLQSQSLQVFPFLSKYLRNIIQIAFTYLKMLLAMLSFDDVLLQQISFRSFFDSKIFSRSNRFFTSGKNYF